MEAHIQRLQSRKLGRVSEYLALRSTEKRTFICSGFRFIYRAQPASTVKLCAMIRASKPFILPTYVCAN